MRFHEIYTQFEVVFASRGEEEFVQNTDMPTHVAYQAYPHGPIYYGYPPIINPGLMAIADLKGSGDVSGTVVFFQPRPPEGTVFITGNITGLSKGEHGFHIHQNGDQRNGCDSMGPHYNPFLLQHGGPIDPHRHVGDLGNIVAGDDGNVKLQIAAELISLSGPLNIAGRGIVVHEKEDDLGRGGNPESLKTGNAGGRLACGVIAYATP
ncbi:hypothetical protein PGB90_003877 [Kerria lacca]